MKTIKSLFFVAMFFMALPVFAQEVVSTNIYDDGTRVGIGTVTPSVQFEVFKSGSDAMMGVSTAHSGGGNAMIYFDADGANFYVGKHRTSNSFQIGNGVSAFGSGTPALAIDSSGNVGVSTLSPQKVSNNADRGFHISGKTLGSAITASNSTRSRWVSLWSGHGGDGSKILWDSEASLTFGTSDSPSAGDYASYAPKMTLESNGYLGVGETSPTERLDVAGNIKLSGDILSDGDICIGNCD